MEIERIGKDIVFNLSVADLTATAQTLLLVERVLKEECVQHVVANLAALHTIFSLQIGTLVAMHVLCYENVAVMKLAHVNEHVRNQLRLVGLDQIMEIHHGTELALESFNAESAVHGLKKEGHINA